MFWTRQLKIEWIRFTPFVILIIFFLGLRCLTASLMEGGFPLALWQLFSWALIAQVLRSEPFERRAFWRTHPVPRVQLALAKGLFLIGPCLLLPILAETFLLWRLHPPEGALLWLGAETALRETFLCLLVAAISLASRSLIHALIALGGLWFAYGIFLVDFVSMHSGLIRGRQAEGMLVIFAVGIPALAIHLAVHMLGRGSRASYRSLAVILAVTVALVVGLRTSTSLPWRLDAAPLHPEPWSEIERLRFQPMAADDPRLQTVLGLSLLDDQLLLAVELEPPLPSGHGLRLRRLDSVFRLASGETLRFLPKPFQRTVHQAPNHGPITNATLGQWFCQGRRDLWRSAGLDLPEEPCEPGIAFVPLAELDPSLGDLSQLEGVLELTLQVDLFRGTLTRRAHGEGVFSADTTCTFGQDSHVQPVPPNVHRRLFAGMLRQHHLPSETVHLLLPTEVPGTPPQAVTVRNNGGGNWRYHLTSPVSGVRDTSFFLEERFKSLKGEDGEPIPPEDTTLLCEEKVYTDRTILRQRFDLAELKLLVP